MGERVSKEALGTLKFSLTGTWRTQPSPTPSAHELEAWARVAWRLKGGVMAAYINQDLLFMEFDIPEEACSGKVLTTNQLKKRGYQVASICPFCRKNEDSLDHILIHCSAI